MMNADAIGRMKRAAARAGRAATYVTRVALYGTRRVPKSNAGTQPNFRPAMGSGAPHSVWQTIQQPRGGVPVVKRNRPA